MISLSSTAILVGIGVTAGVLSGLFGIGGGLVIVPALMLFAGFSQLTANGTSLAVLLMPVGFAAVANYYRHGNVNFKAALIIAVSLFVAAAVSSSFAQRINPTCLRIIFGILTVIMGGYITVTGIQRL
jgi:uncharacterized protein